MDFANALNLHLVPPPLLFKPSRRLSKIFFPVSVCVFGAGEISNNSINLMISDYRWLMIVRG